jgi:hypothetical protein
MTQQEFASHADHRVIIVMEVEFALNAVKPHGPHPQHSLLKLLV